MLSWNMLSVFWFWASLLSLWSIRNEHFTSILLCIRLGGWCIYWTSWYAPCIPYFPSSLEFLLFAHASDGFGVNSEDFCSFLNCVVLWLRFLLNTHRKNPLRNFSTVYNCSIHRFIKSMFIQLKIHMKLQGTWRFVLLRGKIITRK